MATKLDKTVLEQLRGPILRVWNYIGDESLSLAQECGERLSNAGAMEGCIDANRLSDCGQSPVADRLVSELINEHGYSKVSKFLCRHIKLV